jgi:murein DD-endopeptidase MepM/ murein hydrolase activator NlpD
MWRLFALLLPQDGAHLYDLPFPAGKSYRCLAGNGVGTHKGNVQYSWDFSMPIGDIVVAARDGTVLQIGDHGNVNAGMAVLVGHDDGTAATYGHLLRGGILVKKRERILKGEPIGKIGPEAAGAPPHLHFHITRTDDTVKTIPSRFKGPEGRAWNPSAGAVCGSNNAEPSRLSHIRSLRRTYPLLKMAIRIQAEGLEKEMRRGIADALKDPGLAEWAGPYDGLASASKISPEDAGKRALVEALRADFKGQWDAARPLYARAMKDPSLTQEVRPLYDAITPFRHK